MRFLIVTIIVILHTQFTFGQLESFTEVTIGGGGDFTKQPLSPQSNYSHSQTLYYPDQLQFKGYISEIRFFTPFSNYTTGPNPVDPANLTIKMGHTSIAEYGSGVGFINETNLTELTNITRSTYIYEVTYAFNPPFYYDGIQNLVLDMEDLNPAHSTSATAGYRGTENFGNPPTRSVMSLTEIDDVTGNETTSLLFENSYAKTKFVGNLERCIPVHVLGIDNITNNSADFTLSQNNDIANYRYSFSEEGQDIPSTYQTTTNFQFTKNDLLASQKYTVNVKSDCETFGSNVGYKKFPFKTRPNLLTVPYLIDFEGDFQRDYSVANYGSLLTSEAANNSTMGIKLFGPGYPVFLNWTNYGDPFEVNSSFIRTISLDVDLTTNAINPILELDILLRDSKFRIKINDFGEIYRGTIDDFVYEPITNNDTEFRNIVIDLSSYVGQKITIKLEHISKSTSRTTYIDNIELKENDCLFEPTINSAIATNNIVVDWNSTQPNHDIIVVEHDKNPNDNNNLTISSLPYDVQNLNTGTSYNFYIRSNCTNSNSPWIKYLVSTETNPIQVPYSDNFLEAVLDSEFFVVQYNKASDISYGVYGGALGLNQRESNSNWIGGNTTTEYQAWNDNIDFITTINYKIDASTLSNLQMDLQFRQYYSYSSNPTHSWFRILINNQQVGPSYNPVTKKSDPITFLNLDLTDYVGNIIDVKLQQSGRSNIFDNGGISGDATKLFNLNLSGTDTANTNSENFAKGFNVYPNPTAKTLTISANTSFINSIKIYDSYGKLVFNKDKIEFNIYNIDVSTLNSGVYFIIANNKNSQNRIFIKK